MHSTLLALAVAVLGIAGTLSAPLEQGHGSHGRGPETREEQIVCIKIHENYLLLFLSKRVLSTVY